jgi:translation initiation factor 5A
MCFGDRVTIKLVSAGSIKEGSFIVIDGAACKVAETMHSKPGKHGSAKARIVGVGLMDGRKREIVQPASENVEVPVIEKKTAQVLSVNGDFANVMDMESFETFDLKIAEDMKETAVEGAQVLYWIILGDKVMKQLKSAGGE